MNFEELKKDEAFAAQLEKAENLDEVAELFREKGIDTDAESLEKLMKFAESDGELDENALEDVAGGISGKWPWNRAQDTANLIEIGIYIARTVKNKIKRRYGR